MPAGSSPPASSSASLPELAHLRLAQWAHMLGFRGHFSTKSRTYSTTLGALREVRAAHQRVYAIAAGLIPEAADSTLIVAHWHYAGRGHALPDPPGLSASFRSSA